MRKLIYTCIFLVSYFTFSFAQTTVSIGNIPAPGIGEKMTVPITVANFQNVGAITLKISYNSAAIRLDSTNRVPEFLSGSNSTTISIARGDLTPVSPVNGTLINLYLTYLGGNSDLEFTSECEISTVTGVVIPGVTYISGEVTEPCDMVVALDSVNASGVNSEISVGINVTNFVNVGAITFKIQYDPAVLEFESISRPSDFITGTNSGILTIARGEFTAVSPTNGTLVEINFTYLGGNAAISFGPETEIANTAGIPFTCVSLFDGYISEVLNVPPIFTASLNNTTVAEGDTLTFNYNVADPDTGDVLTFSVESPEDATIDAESGLFAWAPGFEAAGTHNVIVTISDGMVSVSDTAVVTVTNTNRAPVFTDSLENITNGQTGQVVTFDYNAEDPDDGETLTYTLVSGPAGATINTQTGVLTYTLGSIDTVTITVSVSDGETTVTTTATVAIVTSITNTGGLPTEYALAQNYPNPFNPTTTIKFSLPAESFVTLKVYNLLGEQVASLVNDFLQASHYEFSFDASTLTSGIYVYKLQAGEFISSKKMTLVK